MRKSKQVQKTHAEEWKVEAESELTPAIGFLRQSSKKQAAGVGKEIQERHIEELAASKGYKITKWIYEVESGHEDLSKAYKNLLKSMRKDKWHAVFVDELPRLGRSHKRYKNIMETAKEELVSVYSYYEEFSSTEKIALRYASIIKGYINYERTANARMAEAKAILREQGIVVDGAIPFGQMNNGHGRTTDPDEMATLRMIDAMKKKRFSSVKIAKVLTDTGRPTKRGILEWEPKTVRNYLEMIEAMRGSGVWL